MLNKATGIIVCKFTIAAIEIVDRLAFVLAIPCKMIQL